MSKWQIAALIILLAMIVVVAFGQEKPKVELKAEVHLSLVKDQNEVYRTALRMRDLESQYNAAATQLKGQQAQLQNDLKNALANSGLDPDKFDVNADTFDVTPKVVTSAKVPGSETKEAVSQ